MLRAFSSLSGYRNVSGLAQAKWSSPRVMALEQHQEEFCFRSQVLLLASRAVFLFCVPFSPLVGQSCLPAGTAPPAHVAQVPSVQTHNQGTTSRNNLLITKTKPKKVTEGQTTPDHSSQIPTVYLNALFLHHRAHWLCLLSGSHTHLQLQSFPSPTALPRWVEEEQATQPATSSRATFPAFPEKAAQLRSPARFLLLSKLFFPSS